MIGIDFNLPLTFGQSTLEALLKGLVNARRTDSFLTTDRLPTQKAIRQMCPQTSRQPSNKNFLLFRSIPLYGFRADNISSEPAGHRNLSSGNAAETLSLWHSRKRLPNNVGKGKRKSQLENLRRLCSHPDKQSPNALRRRRLWRSTESRSLCFRLDNHRFMSIPVSMGKVSRTQGRNQGTHLNGLKRLYTHVYPHYRRKSARCQYSRRSDFGVGCYLHHGSWIPRLCSPFYLHSKPFNFHHKSQKQLRLPTSLLSSGRQNNRFAMRPDDKTQRLLSFAGLSCCPSSNRLLRRRDKRKIHIPNKQLCSASLDDCSTLQMPLADRNLFQMDQTIFENQDIFRDFRERSEDSNLDCHQRLRSGRNRQERTQDRTEFERNLANSQHCTFRESPYYTSTYEKRFAKRKCPVS
jgi:hypothetical protein